MPCVWAAVGIGVPGTERRGRLGAQAEPGLLGPSRKPSDSSPNPFTPRALNEAIQGKKPDRPMFYAWSSHASSAGLPRRGYF